MFSFLEKNKISVYKEKLVIKLIKKIQAVFFLTLRVSAFKKTSTECPHRSCKFSIILNECRNRNFALLRLMVDFFVMKLEGVVRFQQT